MITIDEKKFERGEGIFSPLVGAVEHFDRKLKSFKEDNEHNGKYLVGIYDHDIYHLRLHLTNQSWEIGKISTLPQRTVMYNII